MTAYLLDANICSFILRKDPTPSKRLIQIEPRHEIVLSALVYFELRKGALAKSAPKKLNDAITEFVRRLAGILPFDQDAAEHAARIQRQFQRQWANHRPERHPYRGPRLRCRVRAGDEQHPRI